MVAAFTDFFGCVGEALRALERRVTEAMADLPALPADLPTAEAIQAEIEEWRRATDALAGPASASGPAAAGGTGEAALGAFLAAGGDSLLPPASDPKEIAAIRTLIEAQEKRLAEHRDLLGQVYQKLIPLLRKLVQFEDSKAEAEEALKQATQRRMRRGGDVEMVIEWFNGGQLAKQLVEQVRLAEKLVELTTASVAEVNQRLDPLRAAAAQYEQIIKELNDDIRRLRSRLPSPPPADPGRPTQLPPPPEPTKDGAR